MLKLVEIHQEISNCTHFNYQTNIVLAATFGSKLREALIHSETLLLIARMSSSKLAASAIPPDSQGHKIIH